MSVTLDVAITCHDEGAELGILLGQLEETKRFYPASAFSKVVILDDESTDETILNVFEDYNWMIELHRKKFSGDFAEHKNYLNSLCSAEWILQLDADERIPSMEFIADLVELIATNEGVEAYWLPRANFVAGLTQQYLNKWGWRVTKNDEFDIMREKFNSQEECDFLMAEGFLPPVMKTRGPFLHSIPLVNWPDLQMRLYRNIPDRIKWHGSVHERIKGFAACGTLPYERRWSILHYKTIDKQVRQNALYSSYR